MMTDIGATDYLMFLRAGDIDCMQTYWREGEGKQNLISQASPRKV